ncbi:MAG: ribosomal-processing cysteine protease Prp [Clostridiales bacterium]
MIEINVIKDEKGFIWQFIVQGHAGYDEFGKDIICSAVTVTVLNASNAIEEIVGIKADDTTKLKDGYVLMSIPENVSKSKKHDISVIMRTTLIGFKSIELKYNKFVSVIEEEV